MRRPPAPLSHDRSSPDRKHRHYSHRLHRVAGEGARLKRVDRGPVFGHHVAPDFPQDHRPDINDPCASPAIARTLSADIVRSAATMNEIMRQNPAGCAAVSAVDSAYEAAADG